MPPMIEPPTVRPPSVRPPSASFLSRLRSGQSPRRKESTESTESSNPSSPANQKRILKDQYNVYNATKGHQHNTQAAQEYAAAATLQACTALCNHHHLQPATHISHRSPARFTGCDVPSQSRVRGKDARDKWRHRRPSCSKRLSNAPSELKAEVKQALYETHEDVNQVKIRTPSHSPPAPAPSPLALAMCPCPCLRPHPCSHIYPHCTPDTNPYPTLTPTVTPMPLPYFFGTRQSPKPPTT